MNKHKRPRSPTNSRRASSKRQRNMEDEFQELRKRMLQLEKDKGNQSRDKEPSCSYSNVSIQGSEAGYDTNDLEDADWYNNSSRKSSYSLVEDDPPHEKTKSYLDVEQIIIEVHEALAARLVKIMRSDLSTEHLRKLREKYPTSENINFTAPKLNLEVISTLTDPLKARDRKMMENKNKLGTSLTAISKALTLPLNPQDNKNIIFIELLSDAARLLADAHFTESQHRRTLVSVNVYRNFRESLVEAPIDDLLFGQKLSERMAATKALERTLADLKTTRIPFVKNIKGGQPRH